MDKNDSLKDETRVSVKVIAYSMCIVFLLSFIEIFSYLVITYEFQFKKLLNKRPNLGLDIYEIPDYDYLNHWRLKSGSSFTLKELIQSKKESGRVLGARLLEKTARQYNISLNEVILQINKKGFKGPDFDESQSNKRILTVGDSCTFGSLFDKYCYPRALENKINQFNKNVEVINAGVEGYSPFHVLNRIEELKSLKPHITTIYIGWNALYDNKTIHALNNHLNSFILLDRLSKKIKTVFGQERTSLYEYNKTKFPNKKDPLLDKVEDYTPWFINDLMLIITEFKNIGSKVVLITLPGLYSMNRIPDDLTLKKGHLPTYTNNPYIIAKLTEQYNKNLKHLAELFDIELVDLAKWCESNLLPVESYFSDSVHLSEEGQRRTGVFLANQLISLFPNFTKMDKSFDKR